MHGFAVDAVGQDGQPLDQVLQLAHVAGPGVFLQRLHAGFHQLHVAVVAARCTCSGRSAPAAEYRRGARAAAAARCAPRSGGTTSLRGTCPRPPSSAGRGWWRRSRARPLLSTATRLPAGSRAPPESAAAPTGNSSSMSPISSRNTVPRFAASNTPTRSRSAPVNAPRMAPNSSLSSSDGAIEPQSTGTNAWSARRLLRWIMRATSSLPVPVSPSIITVASVGAARETRLVDLHHGGRAADHLGLRHLLGFDLFLFAAARRLRALDGLEHHVQVERLGDVVERAAARRRHHRFHRAARRSSGSPNSAGPCAWPRPARRGRCARRCRYRK